MEKSLVMQVFDLMVALGDRSGNQQNNYTGNINVSRSCCYKTTNVNLLVVLEQVRVIRID